MRVAKTNAQLHEVINGKIYYFCSPSCRDAFLKSPTKYASAARFRKALYCRSIGEMAQDQGALCDTLRLARIARGIPHGYCPT